MSYHILAIEDEEDLLELLEYNITAAGYQFTGASTGEMGLEILRNNPPDLVLLDWMLPGISGIDLLKRLRSHPKTKDLPVLMLTAKTEEEDIVKGLEQGADDYLSKPFSVKVLLARVQGLLRRSTGVEEEEKIALSGVEIFPQKKSVIVDGSQINLTPTEYNILIYLVKKPGWVFSRDQIMSYAHGADHFVTDRSVDVQIVALRKKMGAKGKHIKTVRGTGYKFEEEL